MVEVFDDEIDLIRDPNYQAMVSAVLLAVEEDTKLGPQFFMNPAAKSVVKGVSHHPDVCRVQGGLVLHVKRTIAAATEICKSLDLSVLQKDIVYSALLLHDIFKSEDFKAHGRKGAEFVSKVMAQPENLDVLKKITYYGLGLVCSCIAHHMGPWTEEAIRKSLEKYTLMEMATYQADYMAARRDVVMPIDSFDLEPLREYWKEKTAAQGGNDA